jgi:hypothetical protein
MGIAPEPPGDPEGVGRGSSSFKNHWTRGLTYLYVRISSPGNTTKRSEAKLRIPFSAEGKREKLPNF